MRGRPEGITEKHAQGGNTPAYAGKTTPLLLEGDLDGKHPRVCGEDPTVNEAGRIFEETPPRMRGRRLRFIRASIPCGNTPAYAGKTLPYHLAKAPSKKHPRVCGEDPLLLSGSDRRRETPPRMRGRHAWRRGCRRLHRNTPAYAGKTPHSARQQRRPRKHPRVCGEDSKKN